LPESALAASDNDDTDADDDDVDDEDEDDDEDGVCDARGVGGDFSEDEEDDFFSADLRCR
jgi:hypothetical protein